MNKTAVIIPIYKTVLTEFETLSLQQALDVFGKRDVIAVTPESLDFSGFSNRWSRLGRETFDDSFFTSIAGYNRLMMSPEFYSRFKDREYVLICQTDAWVFRDDLDRWTRAGFDYVGAPWTVRPVYDKPLMKLLRSLRRATALIAGKPSPTETDWKVGNGGFSLRKVKSHLEAVTKLAPVVERFLTHKGNHMFNEDVFFSLEVNRHGCRFRYPGWKEALEFSFDKYPALCWELNGGKLPMACHSWFKKRMASFWMPVIVGGREPSVDCVPRSDR